MKVDPKASFLQFVYPFVFDPKDFAARSERFTATTWPKGEGSMAVWDDEPQFPEEDLLSHVKQYLNPASEKQATVFLWKLHNTALQSPHGLGTGRNQSKVRWALDLSDRDIEFRIHDCELSLFRVGVGLLTLSAAPVEDDGATWLDFLHYFRFASGQRDVALHLRLKGDPFFPPGAGGVPAHPEGKGDLSEILSMLLQCGALEGEAKRWWNEIFIPSRTLPFAGLFFQHVPETERESLLYRSRCFFHAKQALYPADIDLGPQPHGTYRYADNQYFTFSLDGGAFIGFDVPDTEFFRTTLADHLREQYFLIFLVALHQRFALLRLSAEVAERWPLRSGNDPSEDEEREKLFRDVRDELLVFTARGHFTQIMQRANHHRCYQKWQEVFQINELHHEVSEEVREMHDWLLMKKAERTQQLSEERTHQEREAEKAAAARADALQTRISILGLLIGGPALVIGFLGINITGITANDEGLTVGKALLIGLGGGLTVGLLAWTILWLFRHKR